MNETNFTSMKTPGSIWINDNNNQLRFQTDVDTPSDWVTSVPIYKVAGIRNDINIIKRGQPVSIAVDGEISPIESQSNTISITPTNPLVHKKCIGIAMEPGSPTGNDHAESSGELGPWNKIHVQNTGYIHYRISDLEREIEGTKEKLCYIPPFNTDVNEKPTTFKWTYKDVGKTVYATTKGELTLELEEAYEGGGDIISVGYLIDAPIDDTQPEHQKITVGIQPAGDIRGLVDSTEFLIKLDNIPKDDEHDVTIKSGEHDKLILLYISSNKNSELKANTFISRYTEDNEQNTYVPIGVYIFKAPIEKGITKQLSELSGTPILCTRLGKITSNFGFDSTYLGKELKYINGETIPVGDVAGNELSATNIIKSDEYIVGICLGENSFLVDCRRSRNILNFAPLGHIKPAYQIIDTNEIKSYIIDPGYVLMNPTRVYSVNKPVILSESLYNEIKENKKYAGTMFDNIDDTHVGITQNINLMSLLKIIGLLNMIEVSYFKGTSINDNLYTLEYITSEYDFIFTDIPIEYTMIENGKEVKKPWTISYLESYLTGRLFRFKGLYYHNQTENIKILSQIKYSSEGLPTYEQVPKWIDYVTYGKRINKFLDVNEISGSYSQIKTYFELNDEIKNELVEEYTKKRDFSINTKYTEVESLLPSSKIVYSKIISYDKKIETIINYGTITVEGVDVANPVTSSPSPQNPDGLTEYYRPIVFNILNEQQSLLPTYSNDNININNRKKDNLLREKFKNYIKIIYNINEEDIYYTESNMPENVEYDNNLNYTIINNNNINYKPINIINNNLLFEINNDFNEYLELSEKYYDYSNENNYSLNNDRTKLNYLIIQNNIPIYTDFNLEFIDFFDMQSEDEPGVPTILYKSDLSLSENKFINDIIEVKLLDYYRTGYTWDQHSVTLPPIKTNIKVTYTPTIITKISSRYKENYVYKKVDFNFDDVSYKNKLVTLEKDLEDKYPKNLNDFIINNKPELVDLFNKKIIYNANLNPKDNNLFISSSPISNHLKRITYEKPLQFCIPHDFLPLLKDENLQDASERLLIKFYVENPNNTTENYPIEPGFTLLSPNEKEITLNKEYNINGSIFGQGVKFPTHEIFKGFNYYITYEERDGNEIPFPIINVYEVPKGQEAQYYRGIQNVGASNDPNGDPEFNLYIQIKRSPKYYSEYHIKSDLINKQWEPHTYCDDLITVNKIYFSDGKLRKTGELINEHPNEVYSYLDLEYVTTPSTKKEYIVKTNRYNSLKNNKQILELHTDGIDEIKMLYDLSTKSIYSNASLYFADVKYLLNNPSYYLNEELTENSFSENKVIKDGIYSAIAFNNGKINMLGSIDFEAHEISKDKLTSNLSFTQFKEFFNNANIKQDKFINVEDVAKPDLTYTRECEEYDTAKYDNISGIINNLPSNHDPKWKFDPLSNDENQIRNVAFSKAANYINKDTIKSTQEYNKYYNDNITLVDITNVKYSYYTFTVYKAEPTEGADEDITNNGIQQTATYYYITQISFTITYNQKYDSFKVDSIFLRNLKEYGANDYNDNNNNELILKTYNKNFNTKIHTHFPEINILNASTIFSTESDYYNKSDTLFIDNHKDLVAGKDNNIINILRDEKFGENLEDINSELSKIGGIPEHVYSTDLGLQVKLINSPILDEIKSYFVDHTDSETWNASVLHDAEMGENLNDNFYTPFPEIRLLLRLIYIVLDSHENMFNDISEKLHDYSIKDNIKNLMKYNVKWLIKDAIQNYNNKIKEVENNLPSNEEFCYKKVLINNNIENKSIPNDLVITPNKNINLDETFDLKVTLGEPVPENLIYYNQFFKKLYAEKIDVHSVTPILFSLQETITITKKLLFIKLYDIGKPESDPITNVGLLKFKIERNINNTYTLKKEYVKNSNIIIIDVTDINSDYIIRLNFDEVEFENGDKDKVVSTDINLYRPSETATQLTLDFWDDQLKFINDNKIII